MNNRFFGVVLALFLLLSTSWSGAMALISWFALSYHMGPHTDIGRPQLEQHANVAGAFYTVMFYFVMSLGLFLTQCFYLGKAQLEAEAKCNNR